MFLTIIAIGCTAFDRPSLTQQMREACTNLTVAGNARNCIGYTTRVNEAFTDTLIVRANDGAVSKSVATRVLKSLVEAQTATKKADVALGLFDGVEAKDQLGVAVNVLNEIERSLK
jgi:hypothetical protein